MEPFENLGTVSYSHFVATMAVSLAVCEIFSVKVWRPLKLGYGLFKVIENWPFDRPSMTLLVGHCY